MIIDSLSNAERYFALHPEFPTAFRYLRENAQGLPDGRYEVRGDRLFAIAALAPGRGRGETRLEYHQRYIDIQFSVAGTDYIGWKPASECSLVEQDFDADKDCGLFADEPLLWAPLPPGMFATFFPKDAHAPLGGEGELNKIVVKVAMLPD
jgi:YhcH/YjgK/YiaL family protein